MTSNISRKMHFQFVVFEPTNSSQAVDGTINLVGGNYLQNSSDLILYLVGPTSSEVNGLPTNLYFTMDANTPSSTSFSETGAALPAFTNFPTNYFTSSGNLAPSPGSPGSLGPPTSVDNWGMALGMRPSNTFPTNTRSAEVLARVLSLSSFWACVTRRALRARTTSNIIDRQSLVEVLPLVAVTAVILMIVHPPLPVVLALEVAVMAFTCFQEMGVLDGRDFAVAVPS